MMTTDDAEVVLAIYQSGIDTGHATFAEAVPDWETWQRGHLPHSRIVALLDGVVVGWAALSPVSARHVYRGVCEESVYLSSDARGHGLGSQLMSALIDSSEKNGVWTLQAGIFPENRSSIALHLKHGFKILGTRKRVGRMAHGPMAGVWRDVELMERRSLIAGID